MARCGILLVLIAAVCINVLAGLYMMLKDMEHLFLVQSNTDMILTEIGTSNMTLVDAIFYNMSRHHILKDLIQSMDYDKGVIDLRYPAFNLTPPKFLNEKHYHLFLRHSSQSQHRQPLTGTISLHRGRSNLQRLLGAECGWRPLRTTIPDDLTDLVRPTKLIVPLNVPQGQTYQHFLDGVLPKLMQIAPLLHYQQLYVVLPGRPMHAVVTAMLAALGVPPARTCYGTSLKAEQWEDAIVMDTCVTPPIHPLLWAMGRARLGVKVKRSLTATSTYQGHVVLINRIASHNPGRRILNNKEISSFLNSRYGNTTFKEWKGVTRLAAGLEMFGRTRILIGVHGGGLYNAYLCPADTHIVEVMPLDERSCPPQRLAINAFWQTSSVIGQTYWRIYTRAVDQLNNVYLSVNSLRSILDLTDPASDLIDPASDDKSHKGF